MITIDIDMGSLLSSILKFRTREKLVISFSSALLWFGTPESLVTWKFRFAVICIPFTIWTVFDVLYRCLEWVLSEFFQRGERSQRQEKAVQKLNNLTPGEQEVLSKFKSQKTRQARFFIADISVRSLQDHGILRLTGGSGPEQDYSIDKWVYDYLVDHPDLLS